MKPGPRLIDKAIRANVNRSIVDLVANSDLIRERAKGGTLKIVGGVYDLHTGEVDWLEPVPVGEIATKEHAAPAISSDAHAAPKKHDAAHDAKHDKAHDAHGSAGDEHHAPPPTAPVEAATGVTKDNLPLLGGMLAVGGAVSWGITGFIKARGRAPAAPVAIAS